ncbi:MAG: methyltransferase domain-containing protein [Methylocystis sp.]|nr:methyltransferase domain-containing protein [Methylocystis sp.]MCA3582141.1 methyltransferase domain-containing protein [Methylocystis sp.]MCA3587883.1 methyltransferase domain-containing protein [Methylocystis sp.]MCA3593362.1 methyltransferase domain-containing protein [Methylocystis sp.]
MRPDDLYFDMERREILPCLPARVSRMLDVGCGTGASTQMVRREREVTWAGGIEFDPASVATAGLRLDWLWTGDASVAPIEDQIAAESLDLVLCLDILEHLPDPWTLVDRLSTRLAPGGRLIVSVPNIRNWKFIWRLLARGDFHYRDSGLLDRTHLRFFVKETASALAAHGGLKIIAARPAQTWRFPDLRWTLQTLTGNRIDGLIAKQWLIVAEKRPG